MGRILKFVTCCHVFADRGLTIDLLLILPDSGSRGGQRIVHFFVDGGRHK